MNMPEIVTSAGEELCQRGLEGRGRRTGAENESREGTNLTCDSRPALTRVRLILDSRYWIHSPEPELNESEELIKVEMVSIDGCDHRRRVPPCTPR